MTIKLHKQMTYTMTDKNELKYIFFFFFCFTLLWYMSVVRLLGLLTTLLPRDIIAKTSLGTLPFSIPNTYSFHWLLASTTNFITGHVPNLLLVI